MNTSSDEMKRRGSAENEKRRADGETRMPPPATGTPARPAPATGTPARPEAKDPDAQPTRQTDIVPNVQGQTGAVPAKKTYSTWERFRRLRGKSDPGGNTLMSVVKAIAYIVFVTVAGIFLSTFVINVANDVFAFV